MSRAKLWSVLSALGFATLACSIVMAFLSDHHWYVTYEIALRFEGMFWWVLLIGACLSIVSGIGMAKNLSETSAVRIGIALIAVGVLTVLLAGGPSAILNVHDWKFVLILPVLVAVLDGAILVFSGLGG